MPRITLGKDYNPQAATDNQHHIEWQLIKDEIEKRGIDVGAPSFVLESICLKHGKGVNKGSTKYLEYCLRRGWLREIE